jgi:hypothetical protein
LDVNCDWFFYNQEHVVKGDIVHRDGSRMILFSMNESLEILGRSEKLHCDGTFKTTPSLFYQTLVLYGQTGDNCVPLVYGLLPSKKRDAYDSFFSELHAALEERDIELSASVFISDFESNIGDSFSNYFENITLQVDNSIS